jgi:Icc protein
MSDEFIVVQISDSHLFCDVTGLHHNTNVYQNLIKVLNKIKQLPAVDIIVFTGDLTQDHTHASYQLFVQAFKECQIITPVYYLAGNHDEPKLLNHYLASAPFCQANIIETPHWQIVLMASKSETPAGKVTQQQFDQVANVIDAKKSQLLLMHHHPVDVGFFIDQHGLINQQQFHDFIDTHPSIIGVGCGHIHQALTLPMALTKRTVNLYSCPATSIQFDTTSETVEKNAQGPGFRQFTLKENKQILTDVTFI